MTVPSNIEGEVSTDTVMALANQLSNDGSQPSQQEQEQEQRVPYNRFKEVNDERRQYQEQNQKLLEMINNFQTMQQQSQAQQHPTDAQQQVPQGRKPLFTEDELNGFEQEILLDPKTTLQKFGNAILDRGVEGRVKELEASFEQRLAQFQSQFAAQTLPSTINAFKQQRFNPQTQAAEIAAFDQALQGMDPSLLSNPTTLENVRLAAIGYVADQRSQQPQRNQPNNGAFFSEQPGGQGVPNGWGGLTGQPNQPQIPPQVLEAARKMGVDPKEASVMYQAMNTSGVFR